MLTKVYKHFYKTSKILSGISYWLVDGNILRLNSVLFTGTNSDHYELCNWWLNELNYHNIILTILVFRLFLKFWYLDYRVIYISIAKKWFSSNKLAIFLSYWLNGFFV